MNTSTALKIDPSIRQVQPPRPPSPAIVKRGLTRFEMICRRHELPWIYFSEVGQHLAFETLLLNNREKPSKYAMVAYMADENGQAARSLVCRTTFHSVPQPHPGLVSEWARQRLAVSGEELLDEASHHLELLIQHIRIAVLGRWPLTAGLKSPMC